MILELRGEGRTSVKDGHVGFEEQVEEKEEVTREEVDMKGVAKKKAKRSDPRHHFFRGINILHTAHIS